MPLRLNLRHLDAHNVLLEGELPVEDLDLDIKDELVAVGPPLRYQLEAQKVEDGVLLQGWLKLALECHCARCLKAFGHELRLEPWTRHLPFHGEDAVPVEGDFVDLTPLIREDILLEFPQHPLCEPECRGMPATSLGQAKSTRSAGQAAGPSAWDELNKLKF
jgi:DUF177 domain-containing protein